jgi:hypothetical protein
LLARFPKERNRIVSQRLGFPSARIAREKLDRIATQFRAEQETLVKPMLDWQMCANSSRFLH